MGRRNLGRSSAPLRLRDAKRKEPDLDPVSPLLAARLRYEAIQRAQIQERQRQERIQQLGHAAEILVHLLHRANVGTPKPPVRPFYPSAPAAKAFYYPPRKPAADWRTLLPPATGPAVIPQRKAAVTHGYGSPARVSYRP